MYALTRVLKLKERGRDKDVAVRISWPVQEKRSWSCQWEIAWPGRRRSNFG
jgi:uncharacterized protein DUF6968